MSTNIDNLRTWLEGVGFQTGRVVHSGKMNDANWYAYRNSAIPARECEHNEGKPAQIIVNPYAFLLGRTPWESVEVELTGKFTGTWWTLRSYSISPQELPAQLERIEASLVSAWNALNSTLNQPGKEAA